MLRVLPAANKLTSVGVAYFNYQSKGLVPSGGMEIKSTEKVKISS